MQDIERHEGYEEKYKSMEHEDETGPAGTGGTGVDRRAGECESGGETVDTWDGTVEAFTEGSGTKEDPGGLKMQSSLRIWRSR